MDQGRDGDSVRLPANRAFVVQFEDGAARTRELLSGRAEHLNSGRVVHFQSFGDLAAFIEGVLAELPRDERDLEDPT